MAGKEDRAACVPPLFISGEMTIYKALEIKETITNHLDQHDTVEMDLSGVEDIDTSGIQLIMFARKEAQRCNKLFHLSTTSPKVTSVLALYNIKNGLAS